MQEQNILRMLFFIVFFSVGAAALSISILCDELLLYYQNKQLLAEEEENLRRLEALDNDYDVLLEQLDKDPNFVKRIAPATLGAEPEDGNAIYPRASAEELAAAREVLGSSDKQAKEVEIPGWILRCSKEPNKIILFLAGAFLILISFIFFGPAKHQPEVEE